VRSDIPSLAEVLTRIERLQSSGIDEARLRGNPWDQDAVVRNLEVIGEASKRLSKATQALAPEVPWSRIAGFRDVAVHGYDRIDIGRVWSILHIDLPALEASIRRLLLKIEPTP
jgi:uncharacterized protein with HEPN domain